MKYNVNPAVGNVSPPPIADAARWVKSTLSNLPLINLSQAVPSYAPAESLAHHVAQAVEAGTCTLYTEILGIAALRAALADHMNAAYGGNIVAGEVAITAGCNQAFCTAMTALAGPGDNVIMTTPWYFNYQMWLDMHGVEIRALPATTGGSAVPSAADLAGLVDARTRALVLISPNNPTGAVYPPDTIAAFFSAARAHGIPLVLDETYKDFLEPGTRAHNLFARDDWQDGFIQLYSFSKSFALTGYRVGSIVASRDFLDQVEKVMDCVAICAPHVGQTAALYGLENLAAWTQEKARIMLDRTAALRAAFAAVDTGYEILSAGAFFAYVRHPFPGRPARDVAMALARRHNLLTLPGSMFGPGQDDFLRIAFANVDASLMPEVAARLAASRHDLFSDA